MSDLPGKELLGKIIIIAITHFILATTTMHLLYIYIHITVY